MVPNDEKIVFLTQPAAIVDDAAFVTAALDTQGFKYVDIYVGIGALDIAVSALKVQESDTLTDANTLENGADITATVVGTALNAAGSTSALPAATADNTVQKFEIPLQGRKRYLDVSLTGGNGTAGTYAVVFAILKQGEKSPVSATEKGCAQIMRV